jgi:hypothetical protein
MNGIPISLDKFGRNFLVSSMIPSLAFFTITMITLQSTLPPWVRDLLGSEFELFGKSGFILLLLTIILGFTLTSLNTFIYKVFEGYVLIWRLPFLRSSQVKRARLLKQKQKSLQRKIDRLENRTSTRSENKRNDLIAVQSALMAEYDLEFPPTDDQILPTKFGNILKSAENYPRSRYNIDGVPIWPRLVHVIPADYYSKVDEVGNQLSFLMNCTVLAAIYSLISLGASIYHFVFPVLLSPIAFQIASRYFLLFALAALVSIIFLRATVLVVVEFGNVIRSSYDLFRRRLLVQLDLTPPPTLSEERDLWDDLCDFINMGFQDQEFNFNAQPAVKQSGQSFPQNKPETDNS